LLLNIAVFAIIADSRILLCAQLFKRAARTLQLHLE